MSLPPPTIALKLFTRDAAQVPLIRRRGHADGVRRSAQRDAHRSVRAVSVADGPRMYPTHARPARGAAAGLHHHRNCPPHRRHVVPRAARGLRLTGHQGDTPRPLSPSSSCMRLHAARTDMHAGRARSYRRRRVTVVPAWPPSSAATDMGQRRLTF